MISVLLADDHALVRSGFAMILAAAPDTEVIAEASNGLEGVAEAKRTTPDVVLMDLEMPELNGIDATRRICADPALSATRILMLTTFDTDENLVEALEAGASGFLGKDVEPSDLLNAVRTMATEAGMVVLPAEVRDLIAQRTRGDASNKTRSSGVSPVDALTPRELEVVTSVAQGLNNAEIAEQLFIGTATVKTHIARSMAKLGARDRVHVVIYAYEQGLVGADAPNIGQE